MSTWKPTACRLAELLAENLAEQESGVAERDALREWIAQLEMECDIHRRRAIRAEAKSREFRNRLVQALAETESGEYKKRVATAEALVKEFEKAFDDAIGRLTFTKDKTEK